MKKRILVGGLHHESDTFNPIITSRSDIWVRRGDELLRGEREDSISGVIHALLSFGYEVIPTLIARAVPNGEWDSEYYLQLKKELIDGIKKNLPLDAICLSLHGSMRVRDIGEAEGDLLESIRKIAPDIPIFSSLDMHATITERMLKNANGFVGYKCAPHTDTYQTGEHAARMVFECLEKKLKPKMAAVHIPMLVAGEQSETSVEPMKSLTKILRDYEKKEGVMAASYLLGFPWADTEENGITALVVTQRSEEDAKRYAKELGDIFWNTRDKFHFYNETYECDEAIKKAKESIRDGVYPVVISDSGDNPTAGSSQDVTNFLKMILSDKELTTLSPPLVYQAFYDPDIVKEAFSVGVGGYVKGLLGARYDKVTSTPLEINAKVLSLVKEWPFAQNNDLALLDITGVNVVVTSGHVGCYDPEMMRVLGIKCEECKCIVVKLGYLEPEIRKIAKRSMMALTDGSTNEIFSRLPYKKLKRPIYPLDSDKSLKPEFIEL